MAVRLCPHCDVKTNFDIRRHWDGKWHLPPDNIDVRFRVDQCQSCAGLILIVADLTPYSAIPAAQAELDELKIYPASVPAVDENVPEAVAADFISAANCAAIGEHKAAAAMFRCSLQQIMIEKRATGKNLFAQIDDLATKGIITTEIKNWGHEIRLWGNEGAHPSTDGLSDLSLVELDAMRDLLEKMFEYIYVMPAKVEASRRNRINRN